MVAPAPVAATVGVEEFFTAAIGRALELGLASPEDVLVHATPDVLAEHLPREEWTKLLGACLAAPRTDARLVIDTVTVPVLCEHVPFGILWACLAQVATRALGRGLVAPPPSITPPPAQTVSVVSAMSAVSATEQTAEVTKISVEPPPAVTPPPAAPPPVAPLPSPSLRAATEPITKVARVPEPAPLGDPPPPPRLPTSPGATSRSGVIGTRRPQAPAVIPPRKADLKTQPPQSKRASTATDFEIETDLGEAWKKAGVDPAEVEDDQLIDWSQSEETMTSGDQHDRKR